VKTRDGKAPIRLNGSTIPIDGAGGQLIACSVRKEVMRMDDHSRSYGRTLALEVATS
jgi:hypothetical protein